MSGKKGPQVNTFKQVGRGEGVGSCITLKFFRRLQTHFQNVLDSNQENISLISIPCNQSLFV